MEFLRWPYASEWQLFEGHPEIRTPGRYVVVPDDTPFYPGFHNTWARQYVTDFLSPQPALGECADTQHVKQSFAMPGVLPAAIHLGSMDCIAQGERYPLPLIDRDFDKGWDSRCYVPTPSPPPDPPQLDVRLCRDQEFFAQLMEELYKPGGGSCSALILARFPTATVSVVPNQPGTVTPGTALASIGTETLVVTSGTTTPQQWALQALNFTNGPIEYGGYSTLKVWQDAAEDIVSRILNFPHNTTGRILFVGHSLGGAVSCLLALRYHLGQPTREIHLFTLGCPKPGDGRLQALLRNVVGVHLINFDDPIPWVPPSGEELSRYAYLLPHDVYRRWLAYRRPPFQVVLREDGSRDTDMQAGDYFGQIARAIEQNLLNRPVGLFFEHNIDIYRRRIVCPSDPAPGPEPHDALIRWFRSEELWMYDAYEELPFWQDVSYVTAGSIEDESQQAPLVRYDAALDFYGARLFGFSPVSDSRILRFEEATLSGDFAVYCTMRFGGTVASRGVVFTAADLEETILAVHRFDTTDPFFTNVESCGVKIFSDRFFNPLELHTYWAIREGDQITVGIDDETLGTETAEDGALIVDRLVPLHAAFELDYEDVFEVLLYDGLAGWDHDENIEYLLAKYPPFEGTGPTVLLADTFTDANGTLLSAHTMDVGSGWSALAPLSMPTVQSNKASAAVGAPGVFMALSDAGQADGTLGVDIHYADVDVPVGLGLRVADLSNAWLVTYSGTAGEWTLAEISGGVPTTRATASDTLVEGLTYHIDVILDGEQITLFVLGSQRLTYAGSSGLTGNTNHGIFFHRANLAAVHAFDNFTMTTAT